MRSQLRKHRSLVATVALASAAVAYGFVGFRPLQKDLTSLRTQLRERQLFLVQTERLKSTIARTQRDLRQSQAFVDQWRANSPGQTDLPNLFGTIMDRADTCRVQIDRFAPAAPLALETVRRIPVQLALQGEFTAVVDFLAQIEKLAPCIWITHVQLEPAAKNAAALKCSLELAVFADNSRFSDYGKSTRNR